MLRLTNTLNMNVANWHTFLLPSSPVCPLVLRAWKAKIELADSLAMRILEAK